MALVVRTSKSTPRTLRPYLYSDFFTNLEYSSIKKDLENLQDEESVKRSIKNILLTDKGERFFNVEFGSDIKKMLFENFNTATEQITRDLIKTAINNHEPRANIIDVNIIGNYDQNQIGITIVFSIINKTELVTLEFTIDRVR